MPIYAYKCDSCGFAKDVLQKMSDAPLSRCPTCGQPTFKKQLTAAGFQLKGSGWYATDFKGGGTSAPAEGGDSAPAGQEPGKDGKADSKSDDKSAGKTESKTESKPEGKSAEGKSEAKKADAPPTKKADAAPAPKSGD